MPKTYSTLFPLVIAEIEKRAGSVTSIGSRFSVQPGGEGGSIDARATSEMIAAIVSDLSEIIGAKIISGLDITATTPPSASINISAGTATSHGKKWTLSADTKIQIPFDSTTYVFFVTIYNNTIEISRTHDDTKCELCKIIMPLPGISFAIVNDKPKDGYDAYIISAKDVVYKEDQEFDDASVEKLRDVIGDILADNLIGNIRLSENLKITNTQGTLELDSASIKIKDINANLLAKFNRDGTFFYDTAGRTLAKFSVDEAYLGNILITKNSIQSRDFASGALGSGFQIKDNGNAEFNNILARGKITTSVFEKETISSIGGNFLVSDSDILDSDMTALDSSTLTISGDTTFAINDILRIKDGEDDEWLQVTNASSAPVYIVTRDKDGQYASNANPVWKKGTAVVNFGASGEGVIFMTASESNAPYLSVVTHAGSPWTSLTTHARLGNLNGYLGYSTNLYGIAIGEATKFLKYDPTNGLQIQGIITATSTIDGLLASSIAGWSHASDTTKIDGGDIYTGSITAAKLTVVGIDSNGKLVLSQIGSGTLDNVPDGTTYKLLPATSITSGQIIVAGLAATVTGRMFADSTTKTNIEAWRHSSDVTLIDGGDIYTTSIVVAKLATDATDRFFTDSTTKTNIEAWKHASDVTKIDGGDIYTGTVTAAKLTVVGIDSNGKLVLSQVGSGNLDNIPDGTSYKLVPATSISGGQIIVAGLAAAVTGRMFVDSTTKTNIEAWRHASDVTLIDGGDIYTGSVTAAKITVTQLDALAVNTGTLNIDEYVKSNDYVAGTTGFKLDHADGLEVNTGTIRGKAFANYIVGDVKLIENVGVTTSTTINYVKKYEIYIPRGGVLRIKFYMLNVNNGYTSYGQIFRNGVAVGTEQTLTGSGSDTKSEDISGWSGGDLLQLYGKLGTISTLASIGYLRLFCSNPLVETDNTLYMA